VTGFERVTGIKIQESQKEHAEGTAISQINLTVCILLRLIF